MTISSAQLREAVRLLAGMLRETLDDWQQHHLTVWVS